ncbi:SpaA isopeptide-forming pilin-related protein [Brevibacterium oceani]|uniref:SpaA isopeptide-forming pilin-related protein n=1 Tax=Brevibacterium oceani TaxID=358099 RepID=UPI001B3357E5|nr:SpaA isopeptide-forming pilin-related protein [Brevibacterium oceani]
MSLKRHPLTKHGAAILASSVLASFAFLGAAVAPAQAAAEPLPNPSLADKCGLDIGVVLDLSNSLSDRDVDDSKSAAKSVVSGLSGTPSRVSVNSFATFGPDGTNAPINSTSVATSDSVDELNEQIDALRRVPQDSGGTNWDRGLGQLGGTNHDLVLFVTDGKPTAYGVPGSEQGNTDRGTRTDQIDIDKAIESANALKSQGTKVVGLGVGSEINEGNIKLVSGQTSGDDYYVVSDYSELAEQLREIATKSCRGTLNVTKLIDPGVGKHAKSTAKYPGEGWTISSPDSVDGVEKTTDAAGTVSFKLQTPAEGVRASEKQQEGYRLQQQSGSNAHCTADGRDVGTRNIADGFELTETVDTDAIITCRIVNEQIPGALSWNKVDEDGKALAGAEFTLTGPDGEDFVVADNGELDADEAAGQFEVTDLAWGDYTMTETRAPEGYVLTDETQTVTITGDKRDVAFSDIVNKEDVGAGADPDGEASADPGSDADASTDPDASADSDASPDADASTDPDAAADPDASKESDAEASTDPNGGDDASTDPDGKDEESKDADATADSDGQDSASADPSGQDTASTDTNAKATADPDANAATDPGAGDSTAADPDADDSAATTSNAGSTASSTSAGGNTSADGFASDRGGSTSGGNDRGSDGSRLPRTGAAGAMTFGLLGVILVGGGIAAILVSRRRKTDLL